MEKFDSDKELIPEVSESEAEGRIFVQVPSHEEPRPESEEDDAMLDRVQRNNERFIADTENALQQHWPSKQVKVLDYRVIEETNPKHFLFKVTVDGEPLEVEVEREDTDTMEPAA